jgi:ABC-2 type transport system ATP-binding protein
MLSSEVLMRLEAVGKRYGLRQPWVVRDVSVDLAAGRLIRVEGRNGSGKSTLLRVVAGVTAPSRGRVSGRPHTGYVPERFPGGLPFSGRDYLLHLARVHGLRGGAGRQAVDEWLERLGAADYAATPLRDLSKGMCQKIAIAQALLPRPGLLVLDEAWTGLDQAARATLDEAVVERAADGGRVLFVDHDQGRLSGQADERWRFDGAGRVEIDRRQVAREESDIERSVGQASPPPPGQAAAVTSTVVIIELAGVEVGSVDWLAELPGVLSAVHATTGRAVLRVAAARSDEVLRRALAADGVHVARVQPSADPPAVERPSGERP